MMPRKNKVGDVFGRLTIVSAYSSKTSGRWFHKVVCSCGKSKYVAGDDMRAGKVSSCGCLRTELFTTHGMSNSAEYKVWASMIQRCTNKGRAAYKNYGGRGISVCDEVIIKQDGRACLLTVKEATGQQYKEAVKESILEISRHSKTL